MPFDFAYVETKPDVFSLEGLIAWLETQDPETGYRFISNGDCLLARYFRANGYSDPYVTSGAVREGLNGTETLFPDSESWDDLDNPLNDVALTEPETYGAALDRAKALLAEREQ